MDTGKNHKGEEMSKQSTKTSEIYLAIISSLRETTNLSKVMEKTGLTKQNLNNYLIKMKKFGIISQKGRGWYEVNNSTDHSILLQRDFTRGHAYVWSIEIPWETDGWSDRISLLKGKRFHLKMVGALKNIPRIKILGRKVWLCNDSIRIYDKPNNSYYGKNATESKYNAFQEGKLIVGALNTKLGLSLNPSGIRFRKEHYALIDNELAVEENRRGNIIRISDEQGEWLLIDDSNSRGGELENVGKSAYRINIPMQKWWNEQKETKFEVTPKFILESINRVTKNQEMFARNIEKHMEVLENINKAIQELKETIKK